MPPEQLEAMKALEPQRARRALAEVEQRFAERSPGLEFRVHRSTTSTLGDAHVLIQQVYRGVPVERRDILVIIYADGEIRVLGTPDRFEGMALPPKADLARARAWAESRGVGLRNSGDRLLVPVFERVLKPGARGDNAADWVMLLTRFDSGTRIDVEAGPGYLGPGELFVRDRDGLLVERGLPHPAYAPAFLQGQYAYAETIQTYMTSAGQYWLKDEFGNQVVAHGGLDYSSYADNVWGDSQEYAGGNVLAPNGETAAADAMISLWVNAAMYKNVYRQAAPVPVRAVVHYPSSNSFAGTDSQGRYVRLGYAFSLGDGGIPYPNNPSSDIETVAHEVGHHTFDIATGMNGWPAVGELGALSEGSADILAVNASFYFFDALYPRCNRWGACFPYTSLRLGVSGDWIFGNVDLPWGLRSFIDPVEPAWTPQLATTSSHRALGPLERMYYFLTVGVLAPGSAPTCSGVACPQRAAVLPDGGVLLPRSLTGLGINAASWIWWSTLSGYYFARVTDYATYREAMLEATMTLYQRKPHTPEYKAVQDAWAAVNVGAPADRDPPVVRISAVQKSRTEAEITVEVDPDPSGILEGNVMIRPGNPNVPVITGVCTSRCTWTIDPTVWGSSTSHSVTVTATDNAANTTTKAQSFSLDVTPPAIQVTSKTQNPPEEPYQVWDAYFSDNTGLQWVNVTVDGTVIRSGSWQSYFKVYNYTLSNVAVDVRNASHGYHLVTFNAADDFGNTQAVTHALFTDRIAPQLCTLSIVSTTSWDTVNLYLSGRDDDTGLKQVQWVQVGVGVIATGAGSAPGVTRTAVLPRTLGPGTYSFYAVCTDNQGNIRMSPVQTKSIGMPLPPCNTMAVAGNDLVDERTYELGKTSGTVTLAYNFYGVDDRIDVYYQGAVIATTGCRWTSDTEYLTFSYTGTSTQMKVRVSPNCTGAASSTAWEYRLSCP